MASSPEERIRHLQTWMKTQPGHTIHPPVGPAQFSAIESQRAWYPDGTARPLATEEQLRQWHERDVARGARQPIPASRVPSMPSSPEWRDYDDQIAIRTGNDVYNPPTIATARNRRLENDVNDRRRAAGLPPIGMAPRSTPGPDDVATLDRHRNFEASMGLVPDEDQGNIPNDFNDRRRIAGLPPIGRAAAAVAAARGQAPAAPVAPPPEDPIQENFDLQNREWQDYVNRHGVSPEEAANRTPTGQGGEIRVGGEVVKRTEAPSPGRAQHNAQTMDRLKRNRWMKEQAQRFRQEIASGDTSMKTLMEAYDKGAIGGAENSHMAGAVAAFDITQGLRAQQEAQRGLNVDRMNQQNSQARIHGVPRGFVVAQNSIDDAMAAGDPARASAIAATYSQIYGPSFADWSQQTNARLGIEAAAQAKRDPEKVNPLDQMPKDMAKIDALPPGPNRLSMMRFQAQSMLGEGAEPEAIEMALSQRYQPHAQRLIVKPVNQWSPEERQEFMAVAGKMHYDQFYKYLGLDDNPQSQQLYRSLTGKYAKDSLWPNWLWWGD